MTPVSEKRLEVPSGTQPAPVVQTWIGKVQASAVRDQCRIEIRLHLYLGARLKYGLQQGLQRRHAFPAACENAELVRLA